MQSLNAEVNQLHRAFCEATDRDLRLNPTFERWWFEAIKYGVTPQIISDVMGSRLKRDYTGYGMRMHCLSLKHAIGDDERLAQLLDEAAQIAATRRKKVFTPGKREALESTGRPGEPDPSPARRADEIFAEMRKAT